VLGVGLIFTVPLVFVIWSTTWLNIAESLPESTDEAAQQTIDVFQLKNATVIVDPINAEMFNRNLENQRDQTIKSKPVLAEGYGYGITVAVFLLMITWLTVSADTAAPIFSVALLPITAVAIGIITRHALYAAGVTAVFYVALMILYALVEAPIHSSDAPFVVGLAVFASFLGLASSIIAKKIKKET